MWLGDDGSGGPGRRCVMSARADRNELSPARRRRLFGLGLLRALATTVVLVALYYLLPLDHIKNVPLALTAGIVCQIKQGFQRLQNSFPGFIIELHNTHEQTKAERYIIFSPYPVGPIRRLVSNRSNHDTTR